MRDDEDGRGEGGGHKEIIIFVLWNGWSCLSTCTNVLTISLRELYPLTDRGFWYLARCPASKAPQQEVSRNLIQPNVMTGYKLLFSNYYLLGVKKTSSHTHKTGYWYLLGVLCKISNKHHHHFYADSRHLPQFFCTRSLHTGRFPAHYTPHHPLHCPWRKKPTDQSIWKKHEEGLSTVPFRLRKLKKINGWVMFLSPQSGVIYTVGDKHSFTEAMVKR